MSRQSPQKKKKIQVMRQLCIQRKTQNFQNLKQWDQLRASKLIIHRKIVDQIDESLQVKLSQSNEYAKIVKQYFTDLLAQKNPEPKLLQNAIGRHVYPTAARTLVKLYDATQNSRQFAIVKKVLQESLQKIDDFFMEASNKDRVISLVGSGLQYVNVTKMRLAGIDLQQQQNPKGVSIAARLFRIATIFSGVGTETTGLPKVPRITNRLVSVIGVKKVDIETSAAQALNWYPYLNPIGNYINAVKHSHEGQQQHLANLYDILHKNTQNKYIEEYFSVEELLTRDIICELAKVEKKHETQCLSIKFLKGFLKKYTR